MTSKVPFGRWWQLNYHFIALLCLLLGIIMVVFGSVGAYYDGKSAPFGLDFISDIGTWGYWLILLGVFGAILGGYYVFDHMTEINEFEKLMKNPGRANFIKNLDRIEELAYHLGGPFERRVIDRKLEYRLR